MMGSAAALAQGRCVKELVWADEFEVDGKLNGEYWTYEVGPACCNNEKQYHTDRLTNARVENGKFIIEAHKESFGGKSYTSARVKTKYKVDWKYGRVEARLKMPSGKGVWPAFWMLPVNNDYGGWPKSGEIDIMEYVGYDPTKIHATVHTEAYNHTTNTQKGKAITIPDAETAFHVYAMEWFENKIDFFVDDNLYFTFKNENRTTKEWPFDQPFYIILNQAIGGDWGGKQGIDDSIFPQKYEIDYVRVYSLITPKITGEKYPDQFQKGVKYKVSTIPNTTYTWDIGEDSNITAGQGTDEITIDWKEKPAEVKVKFITDLACTTDSAVFSVKPVHIPDASGYLIDDFERDNIDIWTAVPGTNNDITLIHENGSLRVDYDVNRIYAVPYVLATFSNPVHVGPHTKLTLSVKTDGTDTGIGLTAYLVDAEGKQTNKNYLYLKNQLEKDNEFHTYQYDFSNHWQTDGGMVDSTIVEQVKIFLNKGKGTFFIDDVKLQSTITGSADEKIKSDYQVYPIPAEGSFWLVFNNNEESKVHGIRVFDLLGKEVSFVLKKTTKNRYKITVRNPGIYILKTSINQRILSNKIIIK